MTSSNGNNGGVLDGCSDSCGWVAAAVALVCYGTYGVPIKQTGKLQDNDVNPLVFQTYKTVTMLLLAPGVVALLGVNPARLTAWGLLSGLLWVLGGTGGVVAVRWAGMSTAIATWASVMIMVNFVWGILVFREPVANLPHTLAAFGLLTLGLIGMSRFAAPSTVAGAGARRPDDDDEDVEPLLLHALRTEEEDEQDDETQSDDTGDMQITMNRSIEQDKEILEQQTETIFDNSNNGGFERPNTVLRRSLSIVVDSDSQDRDDDFSDRSDVVPPSFNAETHVRICRMVLAKRVVGIAAAVFNGLLAGSSLIPLHYAKRHGFGGANYMMSYAVGAFTANLIVWLIYYLVLVARLSSLDMSWQDKLMRAAGDMPSPLFQQLWKPGLCAGILLATAMFGSILSVTYLGQGIGNSVIQAKIMIRYEPTDVVVAFAQLLSVPR